MFAAHESQREVKCYWYSRNDSPVQHISSQSHLTTVEEGRNLMMRDGHVVPNEAAASDYFADLFGERGSVYAVFEEGGREGE